MQFLFTHACTLFRHNHNIPSNILCQTFHVNFSQLRLVCTEFCYVFWYSCTIIKHACQVYSLHCLYIVQTDDYYIKIMLKFKIKYWNVDMYMCYNLLNKFT